jgi:hypothetical protein
MNLEIFKSRLQEIDAAIVNVSNQLNALQGHKAEVAHWISQFEEQSKAINENQVEAPAEPVVA